MPGRLLQRAAVIASNRELLGSGGMTAENHTGACVSGRITKRCGLGAAILVASLLLGHAAPVIRDAGTKAWWATIATLAGDDMEGRDTGTLAYARAARGGEGRRIDGGDFRNIRSMKDAMAATRWQSSLCVGERII